VKNVIKLTLLFKVKPALKIDSPRADTSWLLPKDDHSEGGFAASARPQKRRGGRSVNSLLGASNPVGKGSPAQELKKAEIVPRRNHDGHVRGGEPKARHHGCQTASLEVREAESSPVGDVFGLLACWLWKKKISVKDQGGNNGF